MVDFVANRAHAEVGEGEMKGCGGSGGDPKSLKKLSGFQIVVLDGWSDSG